MHEAETNANGGWIDMTLGNAADGRHVAGELIAVSPDTLWVLPPQGDATAIATREVVSGQLEGYDSNFGQVVTGAVLGTISTVSNGLLLVLTAPMWIIGGTAVAAAQSRVALRELPPTNWEDLALYARFPQGMPPGVSLAELRPKR